MVPGRSYPAFRGQIRQRTVIRGPFGAIHIERYATGTGMCDGRPWARGRQTHVKNCLTQPSKWVPNSGCSSNLLESLAPQAHSMVYFVYPFELAQQQPELGTQMGRWGQLGQTGFCTFGGPRARGRPSHIVNKKVRLINFIIYSIVFRFLPRCCVFSAHPRTYQIHPHEIKPSKC